VEPGRVVHRPAEKTHDAEQQVRLPLVRREAAHEGQHVVVTGHGQRQALVDGGHSLRLARGELGVPHGDRHGGMIAARPPALRHASPLRDP
jgi:hypothetical protein